MTADFEDYGNAWRRHETPSTKTKTNNQFRHSPKRIEKKKQQQRDD